MKIQITKKSCHLDSATQGYLNKKIEIAFSRFQAIMESVSIFISDENGPKGGIDKRCHFQAKLQGLPKIVIEGQGRDWPSLIDHCCDRLNYQIQRALFKKRKNRQRPVPLWGWKNAIQ